MLSRNLLLFTFLLNITTIFAQPITIDKIVGVVGKSAIQYSDVEQQYMQYLMQMPTTSEDMKCEIFEDLLVQKLMVTQAQVDSIEVSPAEVEMQLDNKIDYFLSQVGSEEKLIASLGKSVLEIKRDMYQSEMDNLLMQRMRGEIVREVSITPKEVKTYYNRINKDSLPRIEAQFEVNQICIYPHLTEESVLDVRQKLLNIREKVINGSSFTTQAVLYSEGPSASQGGDIGWTAKAALDPAYAKAAFALKKGQVSKIVESSFGYHILQLIEREGDRVHTRHILMNPKISVEEKQKARNHLDSIVNLVRIDSLSFEQAAMRFSMDKNTIFNGGLMVNQQTQQTTFKVDDFDSREYYIVRNLEIDDISKPFESVDEHGKTVYKVFRLKTRTQPHVANLEQDFDIIKQYAVAEKQEKIFKEWINDKLKTTYVKISEPYNTCDFSVDGWKK